mmetsp:Transcript_35456/g.79459  ORF Transcript_35456/g.79459 Transcript_35456/m.79459 type:complete len:611 (+) Transcript_35456:53-1885(+)
MAEKKPTSAQQGSLLTQVFPVLGVVPTLTRDDIQSDVVAGLTVAVMVVPQGMAYAALAALRPENGLYSCVLPIMVYGMLGTSRQLAVGPVAMVALLTSAGLTKLADPVTETEKYTELASLLAFMVGVIQTAMGVFRLDFMVRFLSHPVLSGFTSAAAIVIGLSQLKDLFGLHLPRDKKLHKIVENFVPEVDETHGLTLLIGLLSIAFLLAARQIKKRVKVLKRFPDALFLIIVTIVASKLGDFEGEGVNIVGEIPSGLPGPWNLPWEHVGDLAATSVSVAFIAFLESFAVAKTIAEKEHYEVDARQELLALGLCNIVGSFFRCMPVAGGFGRSAVNYQSGAKSTLASMLTAGTVLMVVLFLTPLFEPLPKAVLGAIIVAAVSTLVDIQEMKHLWKTDRRDLFLLACAFGCTMFVGLLEGILIAAAMSMVLVLQKAVVPHGAVLGQIEDDPPIYRNIDRFPEAKQIDGVLIYRLDAPLFFANADLWRDRMHQLLQQYPTTACVVVHGGAVSHMDSTGAHAVEGFIKECQRHEREAFFAEFNGPCRDMLERMGTCQPRGEEAAGKANRFFLTLAAAVSFAASAAADRKPNNDKSADGADHLEEGHAVTACEF